VTKYVVVTKDDKPVPDLREFKYWSNWGLTEDKLKSMPIGHCELPHHLVGSFLAMPLINIYQKFWMLSQFHTCLRLVLCSI
jgi:hypothetical protein